MVGGGPMREEAGYREAYWKRGVQFSLICAGGYCRWSEDRGFAEPLAARKKDNPAAKAWLPV